MKLAVTALGVIVLSPLMLAGSAGLTAATAGSQTPDCGTTSGLDTGAITQQVRHVLKGSESKGQVSVDGLTAPGAQVPHARTIVATGATLHVSARGQVVALATALQESGLRNLAYGDRDSLGLFQQRPSQGWGTAQQVRDPVHASTSFYEHLKKVSGWQSMTVAQAAQAVQASGFPDAYAKWKPLATALQKAASETLPQSTTDNSDAADEGESASGDCPAEGDAADGQQLGAIPAGKLPEDYEVPKKAPKKVRTALRWGLRQLGTPYQWGGSCTRAHGVDPMGRCDCSSLMQQMYRHAGVPISHTTYTQVHDGTKVSPKHLKPGDLLFTRGSATAPEHVGIVAGAGLVLQAPATGDVVKVSPLAEWKPNLLAARRIVN